MAPVTGEDDVGVSKGRGVGIGGDYTTSSRLKTSDIIFIIADEYDVLGFKLMLFVPVLEAVVFTAF